MIRKYLLLFFLPSGTLIRKAQYVNDDKATSPRLTDGTIAIEVVNKSITR